MCASTPLTPAFPPPPPLLRYDTRKDLKFAKDAPVIGLVLQRSHLVTGDEGHYSGVVSELEARGAKVGERVGGLGAAGRAAAVVVAAGAQDQGPACLLV